MIRLKLLASACCVVASAAASAQTVELTPVFVTASRMGDAVGYVPFSHVALSGDAVRNSANVTIDGTLRGLPGFSSFRRSDSLVSNPSTQGVSLRGLGPTGASRSLVLLDGVPLADAFGGWVLWSKLPRDSLARVELVPGAGGTAWGNAALGGVIQFFTEPPIGSRERLAVRGGSFGTWDVELQATEPIGPGTVQVLGRALSTDGYFTVAPENRGPIDQPATSRARWLTGRWRQALREGVTATLTVRGFEDERGNGTPYQRNTSDERFVSAQIAAVVSPAFQWNATAYATAQNFTSTFSAVNATRTAETPSSDQFGVPATALGFAGVAEWAPTSVARTSAGVDVRDVRGETREDSGYVDGAFTRRRFAGGRQSTAGVFVMHRRTFTEILRGSAGLRVDGWQDTDGHRRDGVAGAVTGDQRFPRRDGVELSPSGGVVWEPTAGLQLHLSGQQAFRRPTLNELYRPFRVGNVITDANPELRTEQVTSAETGVSLERERLHAGATFFWNDLHDAVANVTIARGPATVPGIGFIPPDGEGRRKMNLDRSRVQGTSLNVGWKLTPTWSVDADYLYNDTSVQRANVAPWLVGKRLAQVPRHSGALSTTLALRAWTFTARARWIGDQFDDDNNTLRLSPATLVDASIDWRVRSGVQVFVAAENLWNHRLETGRSAGGLINIGSPRLVLAGVRLSR